MHAIALKNLGVNKSMLADIMKWRAALTIACMARYSPVIAWQVHLHNDAITLTRAKHVIHRGCRHGVVLCRMARNNNNNERVGVDAAGIEYFLDGEYADDFVSNDTDGLMPQQAQAKVGRTSNNRIGGRRIISLADAPTSSIDNAKTAFAITAATIMAVLFIDGITMRFETVQEWRYAWPSLGIVYVISGLSSVLGSSGGSKKPQQKNDSSGVEYDADGGVLNTLGGSSIRSLSSYVPIPNDPVLGGLAALAGIGVLIGGYIDAFFPVWYTSPDLLGTRAGIEADSAAILLILTVYGVFGNIGRFAISRNVEYYKIMKDNENDITMSSLQFPSWAVAVILCSQLWEIVSATFYSWGEMFGIVT